MPPSLPPSPSPQLSPGAWNRAARRLFAKMLAEFAYEEVIVPEPDAPQPGSSLPDANTPAGAAP
ncbi:hypothetical protein, partial [Streptomyces pathocidini]|uniref:hypothetical protein n=1 Tax=Streptomyces pathocidini TaxID=1650571 RepID=UPI0012FED016